MAAAAGLLASGVAAQSKEERIEPSPAQLAKLNALTPEGVAALVTVKGDELEPVTVLTTAEAWKSKGAFTDPVRSDAMLRAFISTRTGEVRWQVYEEVSYNYAYRMFRQAVYATAAGAQSAAVTELAHEVLGCFGGTCSYRDTLGFDLPEAAVREIAAQYHPGGSPLWRFRFKAQSGLDWEDRIAPAEAAGLLLAVEHRTSKRP
ncbi:hypothetical protein H7F51_16880 [Novosphingobium flavum]|uniref:Uncharacterized protein n=1 Tax=Novosphingobium flavum TaxID=1778672 RepID=A0A7X1KN24_9SPHN|nr:hypothetical protein [Novosphingobium flavum]MBC2667197.1 hypothetical protein [Novosphingobium flavum]